MDYAPVKKRHLFWLDLSGFSWNSCKAKSGLENEQLLSRTSDLDDSLKGDNIGLDKKQKVSGKDRETATEINVELRCSEEVNNVRFAH